jgi:hypothetical protein
MMTKLTVQETTALFDSYGLKCNPKTVEHWIAIEILKGTKSGMSYIIDEKDAYEFLMITDTKVLHMREVLMSKQKFID